VSDHLLEAFLQTQSSEGRYFDTSTFTIDSVKALQKLGQFQLADSGLWLVKLVQAAVAAQADKVEITFGHRTVCVGFEGPDEWQADSILETVLSGTLPKDRAMRHLVTAIRGCASSPNEAVKWSCGQAEVDLAAVCRVVEQPHSTAFLLTASRPPRARSWKRALTSSVSDLSLQIVEERDALRTRCWVCPIPIIVDGVAMVTGLDVVNGGEIVRDVKRLFEQRQRSDGYTLSACLGLRYIDQADFPGGRATLQPSHGQPVNGNRPYTFAKPVYRHQTFLTWDPGGECRAAVALITKATAESRIEFVHDGVVVHSHALPDLTIKLSKTIITKSNPEPPLGVRFIFPISEEQLDLSGFAIQQGVPVDEMVYACFPPLIELAEAIALQSKNLTFVPYTTKELKAVKLAAGTGAALFAWLTWGFGLPVFGGLMLTYVGVNRAQWRRQVRSQMKKLRARLEENLQARANRRAE
jgi:hypothetical protein